jgi:hypothetical protein
MHPQPGTPECFLYGSTCLPIACLRALVALRQPARLVTAPAFPFPESTAAKDFDEPIDAAAPGSKRNRILWRFNAVANFEAD